MIERPDDKRDLPFVRLWLHTYYEGRRPFDPVRWRRDQI